MFEVENDMRGIARATHCPFNIRYSTLNHWLGQVSEWKGFVKFQNKRYGIRAGIILLRNYIVKYQLTTVRDIITRFAPSSENNTDDYIQFVNEFILTNCPWFKCLHVDGCEFYLLCAAICQKECGYKLSPEEYNLVVKCFILPVFKFPELR